MQINILKWKQSYTNQWVKIIQDGLSKDMV